MTRPVSLGWTIEVVVNLSECATMEIRTIGIDVGKSWFHLVGCNRAGKPVSRHKLNRGQLAQFIANLPQCLIGMEACPGSQHLARAFQRSGHEVGSSPRSSSSRT